MRLAKALFLFILLLVPPFIYSIEKTFTKDRFSNPELCVDTSPNEPISFYPIDRPTKDMSFSNTSPNEPISFYPIETPPTDIKISTDYGKHILREVGDHESRVDFLKGSRSHPEHVHELVIALKQKNLDKIKDILLEVSDMKSPSYGKFKTREEVGKLIENKEGNQLVNQCFQEHDIKITTTSLYGEYITAKAKISVWETLFDTKFHNFHRKTDNKDIITVNRALSLSIPSKLDNHIHAVFHAVELPPRIATAIKPHSKANKMTTQGNSLGPLNLDPSVITPINLAKIYHINGSADNLGSQTVYGALDTTFLPNDLSTFQNTFGLPVINVDQIIGNLPNNSICQISASTCAEATLNLQYILAVSFFLNVMFLSFNVICFCFN